MNLGRMFRAAKELIVHGRKKRSRGAGGSGGGLAAGTYYSLAQQATPPLPSDPSWTLTTKFDDVGANDHTTYESKTDPSVGVYTHGMVVLDAVKTLQAYDVSQYAGSPNGSKAYHAPADGLAVTEWDNPYNPPPAAGAHQWFDKSRNPADAADKLYFFFTAYDDGFDGVQEVRIGNLRVTAA